MSTWFNQIQQASKQLNKSIYQFFIKLASDQYPEEMQPLPIRQEAPIRRHK